MMTTPLLCSRHLPPRKEWHDARRAKKWAENTAVNIEYNLTWPESRENERALFPHAERWCSVVPFTVFDKRTTARFAEPQLTHPECAWAYVFWECFSHAQPDLFPWGGRYPQIKIGGDRVFTNPGPVYNRMLQDPLNWGHDTMTMHYAYADTMAVGYRGHDVVVFDGNGATYARPSYPVPLDVSVGPQLRLIGQRIHELGTRVVGNSNGPGPFMPWAGFDGHVFEDADRRRTERTKYPTALDQRIDAILGPWPASDAEGGNWTEGMMTVCDSDSKERGEYSVFAWNPEERLLQSPGELAHRFRYALGLYTWLRPHYNRLERGVLLSCDRTLEDTAANTRGRGPDYDPWDILPAGEFDRWLDGKPGNRMNHRGLKCRLIHHSDGTRSRMRLNTTRGKIEGLAGYSADLRKVPGVWR